MIITEIEEKKKYRVDRGDQISMTTESKRGMCGVALAAYIMLAGCWVTDIGAREGEDM